MGAKAIEWATSILAGVVTAGIIFALAANFGLMNTLMDGSIWVVVGVGIGAVIVGVVAAYFTKKLISGDTVPKVIGAITGAIVVYLLITPIAAIPTWAKIIIGMIGFCLGGYLGTKMAILIKSAGTSIIGSFFLFHGLSNYLGGFPPLFADGKIEKAHFDAAFFGYVGGMVVFAIIGTVVQYKYLRSEKENEDFKK